MSAYVRVTVPGRGRIYEHRLVMERKLGRRLAPGELVHHLNGNKRDNRPKNLVLTDRRAHPRQHFANGGKGVWKERDRWLAVYREADGTVVRLGTFDTPEEAGAAVVGAKKMIEWRSQHGLT